MSFAIELSPETTEDPESGYPSRLGRIVLDSFSEEFLSAATYWDREDYFAHWRQGLGRVLAGEGQSCLVTSLHDPKDSHLLFRWVMYREGKTVYFQNGILFFEQIDAPFDPDNPFASIPIRRTTDVDGVAISEWAIDLAEIEEFVGSDALGRGVSWRPHF